MKIRSGVKSGAACYTVQSGDNLSFIARRFYGTEGADAVNKIYYSNIQTIGPNPNIIRPGEKLYIPD